MGMVSASGMREDAGLDMMLYTVCTSRGERKIQKKKKKIPINLKLNVCFHRRKDKVQEYYLFIKNVNFFTVLFLRGAAGCGRCGGAVTKNEKNAFF